jgi:hypothetical protein
MEEIMDVRIQLLIVLVSFLLALLVVDIIPEVVLRALSFLQFWVLFAILLLATVDVVMGGKKWWKWE